MNKRRRRLLLLIVFATGLAPGASFAQEGEPTTLYDAATTNLTTLDPQRVGDKPTMDAVENLFLGLVDLDPQTGAPRPELAARWEVNPEGTEYYFWLHPDVSWVRWDPVNEQAQVVRSVTAGDVVNAVRRACDPRTGAPYAYLLNGVIAGCGEALSTPAAQLTGGDTSALNAIGAQAIDNTTLVIRLAQPAAHFPVLAALPVMYPAPQEIIDRYDTAWVEPGNIVSSGPYLLDEHIRQVRRVFVRNPHLPAALRGPGNVERWVVNMVEDQATALDLYEMGRLDGVAVPLSAESMFTPVHPEEVHTIPTFGVAYIGFAHDKPPFDSPAVRRAFAAAIDRQKFTAELQPGIPMIHLTPPGVYEALPAGEVGVGYNPDYAREQLALAGYPNCQGLPGPVQLLAAVPVEHVAFLLRAWVDVLGCDPALFVAVTTDLTSLRARVAYGGMDDLRPHLWTGVHWPDYPAVYNWLGDGMHCEARPETRRACSPIDERIALLYRRIDPDARAQLVREIEEGFFGAEGEMPVAPWYAGVALRAFQPWYGAPVDTDGLFGGFHLDWVILAPRIP
ncbi:MAG: hypothetical protein JXB47_17960 [Anaerolineae bacterium]|nr:hypothetical protein [Anaerolineae bacterium]